MQEQLLKHFVPYIESLDLKELGFNEPGFAYYQILDGQNSLYIANQYGKTGWFTAATFEQAFAFFREKYDIDCDITRQWEDGTVYTIYIYKNAEHFMEHTTHNSYPEAQLSCLKKLIEIAKKQKL